MTNLDHPWQSGPTEIINHALDHLNRASDLDQRIGFLLLDAGVETLMKTFLLLPGKVTGVEMGYGKRREAAEGNFHQLVSGVEEAAGNRLKGINLAHVQYYHTIRNKLYHQGDGVTVDAARAEAYASLALVLLDRLLDVSLRGPYGRGHTVVVDWFDGGTFKCPICGSSVSIVLGPIFVLVEDFQPVCFPCGSDHSTSELGILLGYMWDPDDPKSYIDKEHFVT